MDLANTSRTTGMFDRQSIPHALQGHVDANEKVRRILVERASTQNPPKGCQTRLIPAPPNLKSPSGVWGQTAPTRVWAAPNVLRLGLVLSPESGRGAATSRTRRVPPVLKAWPYLCCVSGGNPRPFACGFGSAWFYARQQERRPAFSCGTATLCREVRIRAAERNV